MWGNILSGWPVNIEQQKTPTARCASHSAVEFIYLVVYVFIVFLGDEAIPIIKYPDFQVAFIFYLFVAVAFMGYFGSFPGFQFPDVISRYIICKSHPGFSPGIPFLKQKNLKNTFYVVKSESM